MQFKDNKKEVAKQLEVDELEEELLIVESDLEIVPLNNTEELKRLANLKQVILTKLGRYRPLF